MSSNLPPSGPPFPPPLGEMPGEPPMGRNEPQAEVLEQGRGGPLTTDPSGAGGGLRKGLFIAGGVVGAAAIGVGAWAAYSFVATGPQPAEALPADTLVYASIDLDPSGGQKVEALQTLNKFPEFEDQVGIDTDDDVRKAIVDKLLEEAPCDTLDYEDDFESWIGDRAAAAAVDLGGDDPDLVLVVQVKDADAAEDGLSAIKECGNASDSSSGGSESGEDASGGWVVEGDWAIISESDAVAQDVVDAAAEGSLADDEDFQRWTDEAGGDGVVTLYAGAAAGEYAADHVDELFGFPFGGSSDCASASSDSEGNVTEYDGCSDEGGTDVDGGQDALPDETTKRLRDFAGAAVVVRFDDGAIEVEAAGDAEVTGSALLGSGRGGDAISTLPADTGAAFGVGFTEGWFTDALEWAGLSVTSSDDVEEAITALEEETGLELPEDAETLLGESAVLALGSDVDPDAFFNSGDGADVPVALKVQGDPEEIEAVLEKLRAQPGLADDDFVLLDSDSEGDVIVMGPNADYREHVLGDGKLGEDEVFQDVVREVDDADVVFFVNVNELEDVIEEAMDGDQDAIDNLEPLAGFGATAWVDGDVAHGVLRITTD